MVVRHSSLLVAGLPLLMALIPYTFALHIRPATDGDVKFARSILLREFMNPLSVSTATLQVAEEKADNHNNVIGFGQIRPVDSACDELASLYVMPAHRRQGVATRLISQLLEQHDRSDDGAITNQNTVALLTLRTTMPLYAPFGFVEVESRQLPTSMQLEYQAGRVISTVLGNELIAMMRTL